MTASMNQPSITRFFNPMALAGILLVAVSYPALAQATAAPNAAKAPSVPLRTDIRRVAIDVVVTDSQGHAVTGFT
jgi:hypothetical protein